MGSSFIQKLRARGPQTTQFTIPEMRGQNPERLFFTSGTQNETSMLLFFHCLKSGIKDHSTRWMSPERLWKSKQLSHNENERREEGEDKEEITGRLWGRQRWCMSEKTEQGKSGYSFLFTRAAERVCACVVVVGGLAWERCDRRVFSTCTVFCPY